MGKKEVWKKHSAFCSLYGSWNNFCNVFRKPALENNRHNSKTLGFTLLELLIVIGIISVIATIGIAVIDPMTQIQKANDARMKSDLSQIQKALEQYYEDNGHYPQTYSATDFRITAADGSVVSWGSPWHPYMNIVPKSPYSSDSYVYYSPSNGQAYYLYANLKRQTDSDLCDGVNNQCSKIGTAGVSGEDYDFPGIAACGTTVICNYGISSPNVSP